MPAVQLHHRHALWLGACLAFAVFVSLVVAGAYLGKVPTQFATIPFYDTVGHFAIFGGVALLLDRTLAGRQAILSLPGGQVSVPLAAPIVLAVAGGEEVAQMWSTNRTFDPGDLLADLLGVLFACYSAAFVANERRRYSTVGHWLNTWTRHFFLFVRTLLQAAAFPLAIFVLLALTRSDSIPRFGLQRYDLLLIGCVGVQGFLLILRQETLRDLAATGTFHALGLAFEMYKVTMGAWSYPEPAVAKVLDVPLYSGFLYASVGSFLIHASRRFRADWQRLPRARWTILLAVAVYLSFFLPPAVINLRWVAVGSLTLVLFSSRLWFVNTGRRRWLPLPVLLLFLGHGLWGAENLATFLGAWLYPTQSGGWRPVELSKVGAWFLLSFVAIVAIGPARKCAATHRHARRLSDA